MLIERARQAGGRRQPAGGTPFLLGLVHLLFLWSDFTSRLSRGISASFGWSELPSREISSSQRLCINTVSLVTGGERSGIKTHIPSCRLNMALYGTKRAERLCGIKLHKELKEVGAVRSKVDPCLYDWHHPVHGCIYIFVYVDDLIVTGEKLAGVEAVKRSVSAKFEVRDMGKVNEYIGV